jgi:uncharacterized protein YbjT (DUF2867 family)
MKILLTGSTGYIGRRLLPVLIEEGHEIVCLVRDQRRFDWEDFSDSFLQKVKVTEADLTNPESMMDLPTDIDIAYYLVHSILYHTSTKPLPVKSSISAGLSTPAIYRITYCHAKM